MKRLAFACMAVVFAVTFAVAAQQQPPQQTPPQGPPAQGQPPPGGGRGPGGPPGPPPKNLQVLPKEMTRQQVTNIMRGFTRGLGVRCPYCHVGEEGADLSTFDFASDEKATKKAARVMIKMLADVNDKLSMIGDKPVGEPRVSCWTCHRGEAKPASPPPPPQGRGNH